MVDTDTGLRGVVFNFLSSAEIGAEPGWLLLAGVWLVVFGLIGRAVLSSLSRIWRGRG